MKRFISGVTFILTFSLVYAFAPQRVFSSVKSYANHGFFTATNFRKMKETDKEMQEPGSIYESEEVPMDLASRLALEKQKKADDLRAQEVFIQRSTGKYKCSNCDWEYEESKGDAFMIGGLIQPGTPFTELPSNWRCPRCRASLDSFNEVTEEIPGFAVNQGYGFGGNSMTGGQKNTLIFGGLFVFFLLFLGGYGLS